MRARTMKMIKIKNLALLKMTFKHMCSSSITQEHTQDQKAPKTQGLKYSLFMVLSKISIVIGQINYIRKKISKNQIHSNIECHGCYLWIKNMSKFQKISSLTKFCSFDHYTFLLALNFASYWRWMRHTIVLERYFCVR